eukprot:GHVU01057930.1.p1 GENE.GHVU01057930.1~~GHVU01057930.1.p1  ORF type:complete len:104 (-),score=3.67 GHVU01057930.1:21-332(-)
MIVAPLDTGNEMGNVYQERSGQLTPLAVSCSLAITFMPVVVSSVTTLTSSTRFASIMVLSNLFGPSYASKQQLRHGMIPLLYCFDMESRPRDGHREPGQLEWA